MAQAVRPLEELVRAALAGAVYPLERGALVLVARENLAPAMVVTALASLPDRSYRSPDDVNRSISQAPSLFA